MNKANHKNRFHNLISCFAIIVLLLAPVNVIATGENTWRDPREFFFIQSFGDLPEELQTAREQGKKGMFLFFESEGCSYCRAMLNKVFSDEKVQDWYRKHFLSIAVDIHGDVEIKDFDGITLPSKVFSDHRKVFVTPTVAFIDLHGDEIYRHTGMIRTPDAFLIMGEYIVDGHYFDTEFRVFAERKGLKEQETLVTPGGDDSSSGEEE